jgi:small subunit ribosomal protein S15
MARMHSKKKGKSGSKRPSRKIAPPWTQYSKEEAFELILQLAKEGKSASHIGLILRDQHGIPSAKILIGKSISKILRDEKLLPKYPEDLMNLMKKAVRLRKHLEAYKRDKWNKHSLNLIESKIRRLAAYYKSSGVLPQDWYYKPEEVALIVKG